MDSRQRMQLNLTINGKMVKNAVTSFVFSKKYIHCMVNAAIFNILYRRIPLNKKEVESRTYEGVKFVGLAKSKVKDPRINSFLVWIKGIQDAINKNYLRNIYIFFKDGDTMETYSLALKYNTDPNYHNPTTRTPTHVRDATKSLLDAINGLRGPKLADNTVTEIEFVYTEDTPLEYEPPGFEPALEPNYYKQNLRIPTTLLATISTGFHKLTARCSQHITTASSVAETSIPLDVEVEEDQQIDIISTDKTKPTVESNKRKRGSENMSPLHVVNLDSEEEESEKNDNLQKKFNSSNITFSDRGDASFYSEVASVENMNNVDSNTIKCICQLSFSTDVNLINCSKCKKQYHAACYGYLDDNNIDTFVCVDCGTTDRVLEKFDVNSQKLMARTRLFTHFLKMEDEIPVELLESMTDTDRKLVFAKLKEFHLIISTNKKSRMSNKHIINELLPHLFHVDDSQYLSS